MSDNQIRNSFRSILLSNNLDLQFGHFRHLALAFARHHCAVSMSVTNEVFALQAGHSAKTSWTRYGRSIQESIENPEDLEQLYYEASLEWHRLILPS